MVPRGAQTAGLATLYVDGSLRGGAGGGFLVRCGGHMMLGCFPLPATTNASLVEAEAALRAVDYVLDAFSHLKEINLRADNSVIAGATPLSAMSGNDVRATLEDMRLACSMSGVSLRREWCRGHAGLATAAGFANSVADALAALGGKGIEGRWHMPFDQLWRHRTMACDPSLVRDGFHLPKEWAAAFLGTDGDTIIRLLNAGHLTLGNEAHGITPRSALRVRDEVMRLGVDLDRPVSPLAPILKRGWVDEAGSGLRMHPPAQDEVVAVLATFQEGITVGAGWVIRSKGLVTTGGVQFERGLMEPRLAAIRGLLPALAAHKASFDGLILILREAWSVGTMNGDVAPSYHEIAALSELDGFLESKGAEFRAEVVRSEHMPAVDPHARISYEAACAIAQASARGEPPACLSGADPETLLNGLCSIAA